MSMHLKVGTLLAGLSAVFISIPLVATVALTEERAGAVGCTGESCAGEDPEKMGCSKDQQLVDEVFLTNTEGERVGFIDLKYSPTCKAYWAKIVNERFWAPMWVSLFHYDNSGDWAANPVTTQSNNGGTEEYSLMSPYLAVKGCGRLTLTTSGTVWACTQINGDETISTNK